MFRVNNAHFVVSESLYLKFAADFRRHFLKLLGVAKKIWLIWLDLPQRLLDQWFSDPVGLISKKIVFARIFVIKVHSKEWHFCSAWAYFSGLLCSRSRPYCDYCPFIRSYICLSVTYGLL